MDEIQRQVYHKMNQTLVRVGVFHYERIQDAIFRPNGSNNLPLLNIQGRLLLVDKLFKITLATATVSRRNQFEQKFKF